MDVIITILNRLFDEDDIKHYVGHNVNKNILYDIHPYTDLFLNNMNTHGIYGPRTNKGRFLSPPLNAKTPIFNTRSTEQLTTRIMKRKKQPKNPTKRKRTRTKKYTLKQEPITHNKPINE